MMCNQTAFGRKARSVCIVSDLPVRLQQKNSARPKLSNAKIVWLGSVKVLVGLSASGEVVIEIDPP